ncbi:mas-related G-protein coupled receptor member F [Anolis carolinensis]|uniref:mas-related G-protein coupled receptor member F n=1 Tax=Anolis carolinensis TaxID=28377 RepID=UPI00046282DE|nr:PREDICTED: mas-related G-protein coupled receptor member F [Anolis carolinensis]|eukprot:XP_008106540.1 PREDICTED: mas-related G-protein coupled receptor member F [Anolis carolinensis]
MSLFQKNFSQSPLSSLNVEMGNNATELQNHISVLGRFIESTIYLLICLSGFVGNGIIIYLLGFHIKRNIFTTYILNLSIADFGLLTAGVMQNIYLILDMFGSIFFIDYLYILNDYVFLFTFLASQALLIVISIDRCVCFFFPLWYQFHHPPRLSIAVCAIIWILTCLISVTHTTLSVTIKYFGILSLQYYLNSVIFMPIMFVSTIAMLIKLCLKSQQKKSGKLLRANLLILVFFFFFVYQINIIHFISIFQEVPDSFLSYSSICAILNSSINPMIYYLVGRDKKGRSSKRIDKVFEQLFKDDEVYRVQQETTEALQL